MQSKTVSKRKLEPILVIGGSDSSGGAGIQRDQRTIESLGFKCCYAVTALTVQDKEGVKECYPSSNGILEMQITNALIENKIKTIKIGALFNSFQIELVHRILIKYSFENLIVDTVFSPSIGKPFLKDSEIDLFCKKIIPLATLITPNIPELKKIVGDEEISFDGMLKKASQMAQKENTIILLTGGHNLEKDTITEYLIDNDGTITEIMKENLNISDEHGTGCTFASSIAAYLTLGKSVQEALSLTSDIIGKTFQADSL